MNAHFDLYHMTREELAHLGEGAVGYVRKMKTEDLLECYPGISGIAPGIEVWTLFAADGQPILLADQRDAAMAGAVQNDLVPVLLH